MRKSTLIFFALIAAIFVCPIQQAKALTVDDLGGIESNLLYGLTPVGYPNITKLTDGLYSGNSSHHQYIKGYTEYLFELPKETVISHIFTYKIGGGPSIVFILLNGEEIVYETGGGTNLLEELDEPVLATKLIVRNKGGYNEVIQEVGLWGFDPENDFTSPEPPQGLKVTPGEGRASINWIRNTEYDMKGYNVYIDGEKFNDKLINKKTTFFDAQGLTDKKTYTVQLSAVDYFDNESNLSDPVTVTPGVNFNLIHGRPFTTNTGEIIYEWTDGNYSTYKALYSSYASGKASYTFDRPVNTIGFMLDYTRYHGNIKITMKDTEGNTLFHDSGVAKDGRFYDVMLENVMYLEITFENPSGFHAYIYEFELYGNWSDPDDVPPEVPKGLQVEPGDGQATATWLSNGEIDLKGYNIYLNGVKRNLEPIISTTYTITGLENGQAYEIQISAVDIWGNESELSDPVTAIPLAPDDVPPEVPKGLQVEPGDGQATATWLSNSEIDLKGYNIYVNGSKHNLEPISGTRYTISGLQNGQSYDVQISAVDFWGNESELSDPVRVTLETMVPTPRNLRGRVREENSSIVLEWTDGHPDVQGFNVYRKIERPKIMMLLSLNPEDYEKLNDELITETRYTVPFEIRGKMYEFAVTSVNVQGKESEPAKLSVMVPTVPNVISTDRGWGFTAGDIFYNAMVIVASLALFVLLGLAIYMAPRLIQIIRKATW